MKQNSKYGHRDWATIMYTYFYSVQNYIQVIHTRTLLYASPTLRTVYRIVYSEQGFH